MKLTKTIETETDVDAIRMSLPVDYGTEDLPDDYPHRRRDSWDVTVDLATGQIRDWPEGGAAPLSLYMKVVDGGVYELLSGQKVVGAIYGNYVPSCIPGEYGDYVDFKIEAGGRITNWAWDERKARKDFGGV